MIKIALGFVLAFLLGFSCRFFNIPLPAPPSLFGVAIIAAITIGFLICDMWLLR